MIYFPTINKQTINSLCIITRKFFIVNNDFLFLITSKYLKRLKLWTIFSENRDKKKIERKLFILTLLISDQNGTLLLSVI